MQSSFANKVVDGLLKNGMSSVLDMEKAYDHVTWNFLFYMLDSLGFSEK